MLNRRFTCPFCSERKGSPDRHKSLSFHVESHLWKCHRCDASGAGRFTLARALGVDPAAGTSKRSFVEDGPPPQLDWPPGGYTPLTPDTRSLSLRVFVEYAQRRLLFTHDWAAKLQLGACTRGRYAGRLVMLAEGGIVSRTVHPGVDPKYLFNPGFSGKQHLFNERALRDGAAYIIAAEGVLDVVSAVRVSPAVGGYGKAYSDEQVALLASCRAPRVAVMLDRDARAEGEALAMTLRLLGKDARYVPVAPGVGDLGDSTEEAIEEAVLAGFSNEVPVVPQNTWDDDVPF